MSTKRLNERRGGERELFSVEATLTLTGVSATSLARYERARIIMPARTGRRREYHAGDLQRIRKARRLEHDLGVNLPGVEVILRLTDQLEELQRHFGWYESENRDGADRRRT